MMRRPRITLLLAGLGLAMLPFGSVFAASAPAVPANAPAPKEPMAAGAPAAPGSAATPGVANGAGAAEGEGSAADGAAAAPADSRTDTIRTNQQKRTPAHPDATGTDEERTRDVFSTLREPKGQWLGGDDAPFGVSYLPAALPPGSDTLGVVVLVDERRRLPGEMSVLRDIAEQLALHGFESYTFALRDTDPPPLPERTRLRADWQSLTVEMDTAMAEEDAEGPVPADAAATADSNKSAENPTPDAATAGAVDASGAVVTATRPLRRAWFPSDATMAMADATDGTQMSGIEHWQSFGVESTRRIDAVLETLKPNTERPLIIISFGMAADAVLARHANKALPANLFVMLDLNEPPAGFALDLDVALRGVGAPILAVQWYRADPVSRHTWQRVQNETRLDLRRADSGAVAHRVRGWVQRRLGAGQP